MVANGAPPEETTSGAMLGRFATSTRGASALGRPTPSRSRSSCRRSSAQQEIEPISLANLELPDVMGGIKGDAVRELAALAYRPEADAMFIACSGVQTIGLLAELTQRFGIPVLSANQVTMRAALREAGRPDAIPLHRAPAAAAS